MPSIVQQELTYNREYYVSKTNNISLIFNYIYQGVQILIYRI